MWKALAMPRLNKAQRETVAKAAENIGTLLTGAILLQDVLGTKAVEARTVWLSLGVAVVAYAWAIWLRRDDK